MEIHGFEVKGKTIDEMIVTKDKFSTGYIIEIRFTDGTKLEIGYEVDAHDDNLSLNLLPCIA